MAEEVITETTETTETDEKVIIGMLNEVMSTLTMLTEQVTALAPVEDEKKEEETPAEETPAEETPAEETPAEDDEEMSPEEVEKLLFEN